MSTTQRDIVAGLLLHLGGLGKADRHTKNRVVDSINPIHKELGFWQAQDDILGLAWIVALGANTMYQLIATRSDGQCWKEYKPSSAAVISEINGDDLIEVEAIVAAFHDSRHGACPSTLLRIDDSYVYRNSSGHAVLIPTETMNEILEVNKLQA